jgi:hypothetical protein
MISHCSSVRWIYITYSVCGSHVHFRIDHPEFFTQNVLNLKKIQEMVSPYISYTGKAMPIIVKSLLHVSKCE